MAARSRWRSSGGREGGSGAGVGAERFLCRRDSAAGVTFPICDFHGGGKQKKFQVDVINLGHSLPHESDILS